MNSRELAPPPAPDHTRRLAFLDVARAIAACSVMVQHALEGGGLESLEKGAVATSWINFGEVGVAIFFLVSGFIIPASMRGPQSLALFWTRRILRLYPLYWVIFLFTLLLSIFLLGDAAPAPLPTVLSHLVFVQSWIGLPNYVGGSWTLLIELMWYVAFSAAFFTFIGVGLRLVILFLLGFPVVLAVGLFAIHGLPLGRFSILALSFWGYGYFLYFDGQIGRRAFMLLNLAFVALIYSALFIGFYLQPSTAAAAPDFRCVFFSWTLALVIFPALMWCRDSSFARLPALCFVGEISYSVYLVHSPIMRILEHFDVSGVLFVLATIVLTLLIATITYRYIERPGMALSRALTQRLKAQAAGRAASKN